MAYKPNKTYRLGRLEIKWWTSSQYSMFDAGFFFRISLGRLTIDWWKKQRGV